MKFPTTERLLPELALSSAQRDHYRLKAKVLVEDAIAQYETYARVHQRRISRSQWKPIKKREHLIVYKERKQSRRRQHQQNNQNNQNLDIDEDERDAAFLEPILTPSTVRSTMSPFPAYTEGFMPTTSVGGVEWKLPTLLMVGSIVGTLDDVMYGVATFDAPSMLLKTTYTHDELIDGEILNQICGPTPEDPFQFVGIKWVVKGNPAGYKSLVRPRDLVFLEATGIETRWNGDRYGFHLMHSLEEFPNHGPLNSKSVLRGKIQSCVIYKPLSNGTVDVYMKANFEPNGSVRESVALISAANGLSYCWRSVVCAEGKKLAWLLTQSQERARNQEERATTLDPRATTTSTTRATTTTAATRSSRREKKKDKKDKNVCCGVCRKSANAFRHMNTCELCLGPMCSRCKVSKKLSCIGTTWRKEITQREVLLCKSCVAKSIKSDTFEIARDEVLSGKWELESDISIMPMPSRSSSQEERKQSEKRGSEALAFDKTLKLSIARMDSRDDTQSSYPESFPIAGHLWPGSYDSAAADELDQEYYFDEQGRASEVPRSSTNSSVRQSNFVVDVGGVSEVVAGEFRYSSRITNFIDLTGSEYSSTGGSFSEYPASRQSSSASSTHSAHSQRPMAPPVELYPVGVSQPSSSSTFQEQLEQQQQLQLQQQSTISQPELEAERRLSHQQFLLQQITQLRDAAEHVYQITKHNSEVHASHVNQVWPSVR